MYKNLHPHNFVKNKGYSYMHKNQGTVSETHAISSLLLLLLPSVESSRVTTYKELKWHRVKKQQKKHVSSLATDCIFHLLCFFFCFFLQFSLCGRVCWHFLSCSGPLFNQSAYRQSSPRLLKGFIHIVCTYQDNNMGSKRLYVTQCSSVCAICVPQREARFPPPHTRFIHTRTFWHLHGGRLFNSNWKRNNGYI